MRFGFTSWMGSFAPGSFFSIERKNGIIDEGRRSRKRRACGTHDRPSHACVHASTYTFEATISSLFCGIRR